MIATPSRLHAKQYSIWQSVSEYCLRIRASARLQPAAHVRVQVGTEKLIVTGRIRIALRPLIEELPVVAAIQVHSCSFMQLWQSS